MEISVVLCTYNNAGRLRVTLQSFCRLNQPEKLDWELVTVNNNSTDNTKTVIKSFDDRLPIRYVYEPEQGLSRARNAGLEVAEGELIVFTDDDVKPNPNWLTAYWEAYREHPEGYYFGGPIESEYEGPPPDEDLLRVAMPSVAGLDLGDDAHEAKVLFNGANWACPSDYLQRVGVFDESKGLGASGEVGEENDLMTRLELSGISGWYKPRAKIKHYVPSSKSSLNHVLKRTLAEIEAGKNKNLSTLFGMPFGVQKEMIKKLTKFIAKKSLGMNWKKEYVEYRKWKKRNRLFRS